MNMILSLSSKEKNNILRMRFFIARILYALINSNEAIQAIKESVELTTMRSETKSVANSTTERFNQVEKELTANDTFPTEPLFISLLAFTIVIIIIASIIYFMKKKASKETKISSNQTVTNTQPIFAIAIPGFA